MHLHVFLSFHVLLIHVAVAIFLHASFNYSPYIYISNFLLLQNEIERQFSLKKKIDKDIQILQLALRSRIVSGNLKLLNIEVSEMYTLFHFVLIGLQYLIINLCSF